VRSSSGRGWISAAPALGCAILALPVAPLIFWVGSIILHNSDDSIVRFFEIIGIFWFGMIAFYVGCMLFFGAGEGLRNRLIAFSKRIRRS
jgi:hypothetical protein